MAVERLDPGQQRSGDPGVVEHYARYAFAAQFVVGKRVLDVACGTGYGSQFLLDSGASAVTGVDISTEAIATSRERYPASELEFIAADAEALATAVNGPFDVIASFETLEHLHNPDRFLTESLKVSHAQTVFVLSVPNDVGLTSDNPFHLTSFDRVRFTALLESYFSHVDVLSQSLALSSIIQPELAEDADVHSFSGRLWEVDEPQSPADCLIAVCSRGSRMHSQPTSMRSRSFWKYYLELEQARNWLSGQLAQLEAAVRDFERITSEQRAWIADMQLANTWSEDQRSSYERSSLDQSKVIAEQQTWLAHLQEANAWYSEQQAKWAHTAQEQASLIAEQNARITELEAEGARLRATLVSIESTALPAE